MKRTWSKEIIVENIQKLKQQNVDLSASNIMQIHIPLFTAACSRRYFSSWANAVKAAGIDYGLILEAGKMRRRNKLKKWTKELLLEKIRRTELIKLLKIYRDDLPLYSAARREFGSWKKTMEAAGYQLTKGSHKNSNQIFRSDGIDKGSKGKF